MSDFVPLQFEDVGKMRVELEQARAEIERLNNIVIRGLAGVELSEENDRLIVEIERLRALLHRWLVWNGEGRAHDLADESRRALAGEQEKMG